MVIRIILLDRILMKSIQLRRFFFPNTPFVFWRWLPIGIENALNVDIDGIKFKMCVDLKYKETSVTGEIKPQDVPTTSHWIQAFFIYLTVPVDDATEPKLFQMNPPEELIAKLASAIRKFEALLYGIVRNEIGQFWLSNSHEIDSLSDRETLINMEILNQEKKWVQFCVGTIKAKSPIPRSDILINKERWFQFKNLIENNYKSDLSLVFFRNAEKYLRGDNYRLAIVEACIALERAINVFIKDHLTSKRQSGLRSVINGNSLTKKVKMLLPELLPDDVIDDTVIQTCSDAVNLRNNIIHNSQVRNIELNTKKYLNGIKKILEKLNSRKFRIVNEDPWDRK